MAAIDELLQIMRTLRDPRRGCSWDRAQDFASIAPSTLEEAYEVVDAIERSDWPQLRDELGDLLFQVVFHAQMAAEQDRFDFDSVAAAICDKLIRRHPHVFAGAVAPDLAEQSEQWEAIKARERGAAHAAAAGVAAVVAKAGSPSADGVSAAGDPAAVAVAADAPVARPPASELDGVAYALPALTRAVKLSKRAARVGFDWERPEQTADKVAEELREVLQAMQDRDDAAPSAQVMEEVGDLLFAAANLARKLNVDAEGALRAANAKFERRFRHIEAALRAANEDISQTPLVRLEALWEAAKAAERALLPDAPPPRT